MASRGLTNRQGKQLLHDMLRTHVYTHITLRPIGTYIHIRCNIAIWEAQQFCTKCQFTWKCPHITHTHAHSCMHAHTHAHTHTHTLTHTRERDNYVVTSGKRMSNTLGRFSAVGLRGMYSGLLTTSVMYCTWGENKGMEWSGLEWGLGGHIWL